MSKPFPNDPLLQGNFAPIMAECDAPDLVAEGEIPQALRGTLYRNGPNPMFPPLGRDHHWFLGEGRFVHEPVFVPRKPTAAEGDGWIVTLVYDQVRNLSDFVVLDTDDISKGPIARAELPVRVPFGFQGSWRNAA